jgi:excisionase family DNA binding protein
MSSIQPQATGRAALSVPEVMAATGLGRDKVYALIRDGQLIAKKCGRRTLIVASDLQRFLEELPALGRAA